MQVLMPSGEVTSDNVGVVCDVACTNDIGLVVRNRVKRSSPRDCKKTGNWTGQDRKRLDCSCQLPHLRSALPCSWLKILIMKDR